MRLLKKLREARHITAFDIAIFLRQFATLLTAGIPILKCCEVLEKTQIKTRMRFLVYSIKRELLAGKDFYSSLRTQSNYFNEFTLQLVKLGEHTGTLDSSLQMIADEQEKQLAIKKRIKHALFYPCLISVTAIVITISMFIFIIPRFAELFSANQVKLPAFTRALFFISAALTQHVWLLLFLLPFLPIIFFTRSSILTRILDLPLINPLLHKIRLARFARHLAISFAAGLPIAHAIKLVIQTHNNPEFLHGLMQLYHKIHAGFHLHEAMQALTLFPDFMIQMVKIGEESGSLDHMLEKTAGVFEADIEQLLDHFTQMLEPLIMLILGVLIGGLLIGMYLPIFKLGSIL